MFAMHAMGRGSRTKWYGQNGTDKMSHFYANDSQLYTWALHRQFHSSGVIWNLVLSGSPNGCVPTDCGSTPRRRISCGAQPADGVSILTPINSNSVRP